MDLVVDATSERPLHAVDEGRISTVFVASVDELYDRRGWAFERRRRSFRRRVKRRRPSGRPKRSDCVGDTGLHSLLPELAIRTFCGELVG